MLLTGGHQSDECIVCTNAARSTFRKAETLEVRVNALLRCDVIETVVGAAHKDFVCVKVSTYVLLKKLKYTTAKEDCSKFQFLLR